MQSSSTNFLITVVGPTAIGKTALAIQLAKHFNSEIISCDSRQFFKEMSIGTAVPTKEELAQVPHHFIQNKSIHQTYNVGDFERESLYVLESLFKKNNIQILVGGSGLYVDALLKGFDSFPEVSNDIKNFTEKIFEEKGLNGLQELLKQHDCFYFKKLEQENPQTLQNPQRMKRFVGVCLADSKPYSSYLNQNNNSRNFVPITIGLQAEREQMYQRINLRTDNMIAQGLLKEVESLYAFKHLNALQTVGYRELFSFFDNDCSLDFAIDEIKKNTRRFAKRQLTWFKRMEQTTWFDFKTETKKIITKIESNIKTPN